MSGKLKWGETQQIMPSFDVVSQVDWHEVANAIDQTNREVRNRFDFKGSDARVEQADSRLMIMPMMNIASDRYGIFWNPAWPEEAWILGVWRLQKFARAAAARRSRKSQFGLVSTAIFLVYS